MDALITTGGPLTMSSREIAALVELRHDNVKRTIDSLAQRGLIHPQTEDEAENDALGRPRTTKVYRVGKRDSYVVVAQLSPEFTARLVDRWQELEAGAAPALNLRQPGQLLAVAAQLAEIVQEQQAQLEAQAPRVAFADAVAASDDDQTISQVAKVLGTGPRKFFEFLRDEGVLMVNNLPYQHHIDCGRFRVVEVPFTDPSGAKRLRLQARVTGRGITFLQQRHAKASATQGA